VESNYTVCHVRALQERRKGECEMSAQLDSHGPVEPHARHVTADGRVAFKAPVGALIFTNTISPHHLPLAQVYTTDAFNPDDS
jgi:hypothetical protein